MKKTTLKLLFAFVAIGTIFFTSCEDLDESEAINITLSDSALTVTAGNTASIDISVVCDAKIESIEIRKGTSTYDTKTEFTNNTSDVYDFSYLTSESEAGTTISFAVIVTDKKDNVKSKSFTVTVESVPITLSEHTAILLGAQSSSEPSCASLETGATYSISGSDAANNSASVDIVHYNGAKDVALYSPSNADIQGVSAYNITSWATKNSTSLSLTSLTSSDFASITTDVDLDAAGTPSGDVVGLLSVGDVVVFETAGGKKGVFMVSDLEDSSNGSVTIEIKVEP